MHERSRFAASALPYLLIAPQLAITGLFFLWPAGVALWQSTQMQDAFGTSSEFVGLANFAHLFADPLYLDSFKTTLVFSALVTVAASLRPSEQEMENILERGPAGWLATLPL